MLHETSETTREIIALPFETAAGILLLPVCLVALPVFLVVGGLLICCH